MTRNDGARGDARKARESARLDESYTIEQIREAFARHASPDSWGVVDSFYEGGLIAALRGEYDDPEQIL